VLRPLVPALVALLVSCAVAPPGAGTGAPYTYRSERLMVVLDPRTPEQIAAFYEARGFDASMIDLLSGQCYVTVFIHNTGQDVIWLDLAQWRFSDAEGEVARLDRGYWQDRWAAMRIPMAHQSTFRWTLLPETLDFRPDEAEGGNIILPRSGRPLTVSARFDTGADRSGTPIQVRLDDIQCADSP
jgi:hypothetical protein